MADNYTLYGVPHSLYTGRARSYLIKNSIPFQELSCGHESFKDDIVPKAKLSTIPTLLTPAGEVIRDGAAIIEYFESANGHSFSPKSPQQRLVSDLFDVIGAEGLLRPAMHYRWNFPDENLDFLTYHFLNAQRLGPHRQEKTDHIMNKMRFAGRMFGVSDTNHEFVESLYMTFLRALDKHFATVPYLLGWKPCIGDFGLLAPMFAHLGRDPKPLAIMQREAIHVYRWVERMNSPGQDAAEFFETGVDYLSDDLIPETLIDVLRILAEDFVPETHAAAESINGWLADNNPAKGTGAARYLGQNGSTAEFTVRGEDLVAGAQPYRFYLLQRVHDHYALLDSDDQVVAQRLLKRCDLATLLDISLARRLGREDNLEVWL
jgi:glutathione S-transferase